MRQPQAIKHSSVCKNWNCIYDETGERFEILQKRIQLCLKFYPLKLIRFCAEYAVEHKLWGHAFLLASQMGTKYYSNVLAKFDASMSMSNPLKTLYQLHSKQIPLAATVSNEISRVCRHFDLSKLFFCHF